MTILRLAGLAGLMALGAFSMGSSAKEQGDASGLLCAITHTVSCDSAGDCVEGPANAINLPVFMDFRPSEKIVRSAKAGAEPRTSQIESVASVGDVMQLRGAEGQSMWTATINESTGGMTGAITGDGLGFLVFGSCIAH